MNFKVHNREKVHGNLNINNVLLIIKAITPD